MYIYFVNYYDIILPLVQSQFPGGGAGEATTVWRTGEELSYESEVRKKEGQGEELKILAPLLYQTLFHQLSDRCT